MSMQDPIADMLTRIRNAHSRSYKTVVVPHSKHKEDLARVLKEEGYIVDFTVAGEAIDKIIDIELKYTIEGVPVIEKIKRISRPGLRIYKNCEELPKVVGTFGIEIISTSKGLMSHHKARANNVGGEAICAVW